MDLSNPNERKAWMPYINAVISLCSIGKDVGYFIVNPTRQYNNRSKVRPMLSSYGIYDKETLLKQVDWLIATGRRHEFEQDARRFSVLTEAQRNQYMESIEDEERILKMAVVNKYFRRLPSGGIGAYDFSWAMYLCMIGRQVGYLRGDETWDYAAKIIALIKANFSNWQQYTMSYIAAMKYHPYEEGGRRFLQDNKKYIMQMMSFRENPMLHIEL
ncbi:DUF1266 domain-containing protein [Paenibacillus fonticola]|uniref:DUF1266 domain-containing protein n=1 Tax=Paenibacillus fonticola TaxID=379896 RepID=UPI00036662EF|nr:DUF1266 domain-containing protein [Paenibacillus fonticola]